MKIVMAASECIPYIKTGGLADVVGALPGALKQIGHEVIVILPLYSSIEYDLNSLYPYLDSLGVWMGNTLEWCSVHTADMGGTQVYFIESQKYFSRYGLYHDASFNDYLDNPYRFGFLSRAALQLCKDIGFEPDIVHVHDWHTALIPGFLKIWHWNDPILSRAASVLTIHNLAYQGVYDKEVFDYLGLRWENFTSDRYEDNGKINFLKGGIVFADMVNTVSPTYARETLTPSGGYGLAPYLSNRGDSYLGILNGCDYENWNPATDPLIPARYTSEDLSGKAICKQALQERFNLEVNHHIPIIGVVSRLVNQKGLDLLAEVIESIVSQMQVQFAILGSGEKALETFYGQISTRYAGKIGSFIGYSNELSHLIEAGSDFFIMPSIYEPCGLNQMYSLKYGTLPIVRATGGLDDTVQQYDERSGQGTGFKFWEISAKAIYYTVGWAVSTYYDRPQHMKNMIKLAMIQDYSWEKSALAYLKLYQNAIDKKSKPAG